MAESGPCGWEQNVPLEHWDAELLQLPGQFLHSQYKGGREIVFALLEQVSSFTSPPLSLLNPVLPMNWDKTTVYSVQHSSVWICTLSSVWACGSLCSTRLTPDTCLGSLCSLMRIYHEHCTPDCCIITPAFLPHSLHPGTPQDPPGTPRFTWDSTDLPRTPQGSSSGTPKSTLGGLPNPTQDPQCSPQCP